MDPENVDYERIKKIKLRDVVVATTEKRLWAIADLSNGTISYKVEEVRGKETVFGHSLENAVDFYNSIGGEE